MLLKQKDIITCWYDFLFVRESKKYSHENDFVDVCSGWFRMIEDKRIIHLVSIVIAFFQNQLLLYERNILRTAKCMHHFAAFAICTVFIFTKQF